MTFLFRAFPLISFRPRPPFLLSFHSVLFRPFFPKALPLPLKRTVFSVSSASSTPSSSSSTETLIATPKPTIPLDDTLHWVGRTGFCGELSVDDVGKWVRLCGWVALHRVHGGLTFLNLRDHTGTVQVCNALLVFLFHLVLLFLPGKRFAEL